MRLDFRHLFPCTAEELWSILADPVYQAEANSAASVRKELLESRAEGKQRVERVRVHVQRELPAPMARALDTDRVSYVQEHRWRDEDLSMKWVVIPDVGAKYVQCRGDFRVANRGKGECERLITGDLTVSVPLLGGRMEKKVAEDLKANYDATAKLLLRYIQQRAQRA